MAPGPSPSLPTAYAAGRAAGERLDAGLTARYLRHTTLGDPEADALMEAFASYPAPVQQRWTRLGIEQGPAALGDAPDAVRAFFAAAERVPDWFDPAATAPGCRAFHRHSEMFLGAFVGAVLVEGFATLIAKSFALTGRLTDQGVRRLKQNNLHLVEIFMPGGLGREGEGWRLSLRIRLIHARVRRLAAESPEWDAAAWGVPLSAAHIGYAAAAFSGLLLRRAEQLGVRLSGEERASFMMIWRYSAHLMGVAPELLFASEEEALLLQRVGAACEPPPELESILLAHALVQAAPIVAGITEAAARKALVKRIYSVSRALIGDPLADRLRYPPMRTLGVLSALRWSNRAEALLHRLVPALRGRRLAGQFQRMLELSFHDPAGIGYRLPQTLHAEKDGPL